jgi:hypothetical protein
MEEIGDIAEMATGMADLFGQVCRASLLKPRIGDDAEDLGDGEIALADVSFDDKAFIFQLAIQPAQILRKFCEKQEADLESVRTGDDTEPEAE